MPRQTAARPKSIDWRTLGLLVLQYVLLLGNWSIYWSDARLPLWLHILVPTLGIHLAFTIWHEAAHKHVSSSDAVNDVVGVLGMLPYMTPYFMQRWIHLEHHRKLNQRDDPNFVYLDGPFALIFLRYPRAIGYAKQLIRKDPRSAAQRYSDVLFLGVVASLYLVALWQGVFLELLGLWFLPLVIAKIVMDWYINYLPHVGLPADRFEGTRILDVSWFTPLVLCHNYHAIHHLWPNIPWHRYPATYRTEADYLKEKHVPIEQRVFGSQGRRAKGPA